jgi:hypothetical protein
MDKQRGMVSRVTSFGDLATIRSRYAEVPGERQFI